MVRGYYDSSRSGYVFRTCDPKSVEDFEKNKKSMSEKPVKRTQESVFMKSIIFSLTSSIERLDESTSRASAAFLSGAISRPASL